MPRYILTDLARSDILQIHRYIAQHSPNGTRKVRTRFRASMELLAQFPGIGHLRHDLTEEPIRFWRVYSYLIVYRPDSKPLQIVRVIHGARDMSKFFVS